MNLSNFSNFSALSPSPSAFPSPDISSPAPSSSPSVVSPSSFDTLSPAPSSTFSPAPSPGQSFPSPSYERFNHTTLSALKQKEINFFLAFVGISFCAILIFLYFARKYLYGLLRDSRQYVDVAAGDTELKRIFKSGEASKSSYGEISDLERIPEFDEMEEIEELEHKREMGNTASV